jgi:repressor LexA
VKVTSLELGAGRNIRLNKMVEVLPLVGRIAAGKRREMIAELEQERIDVNALLANQNRFLLEVKGDSMIGDNICDGDLVICEKAAVLKRKGQIAVVIVKNSEATLKRIMREGNKVILIPSNPNLIPMEYEAEDIQIQGFYLGLLRLRNLQH